MSIMASTWSDSRVVSGTVASTSESQIGSDINIPQNQTWLINGLLDHTHKVEHLELQLTVYQV